MTKEQKAKEIIAKIRKGSHEDWVQWVGDGLEEYAAIKLEENRIRMSEAEQHSIRYLKIEYNHQVEKMRKLGLLVDEYTFEQCVNTVIAMAETGRGLPSYAGSSDTWQSIATAPKDGTTIEVSYDSEHTDTCLAMWSQRPVCMGGSTVYNKPGWATSTESECDTNLPLDTPLYWRPYAGSAEGEKEQLKELDSYNYLPQPNEKGERYPGESDQDLKDAIIIGLEEGSAQWEERARFAEKQVEELKAAVRSFEEKSPYNSMKASVLDPYGHIQRKPVTENTSISLLNELREKSVQRAIECFKTYKNVPITYWTTALAGEMGELCNMVKKMERVNHGGIDAGSSYTAATITPEMLKEEIGGIAIYLDLLASLLNIDLEAAIVDTFNEKSVKYGFPYLLQEPPAATNQEGGKK